MENIHGNIHVFVVSCIKVNMKARKQPLFSPFSAYFFANYIVVENGLFTRISYF